MRSPAQDIDVLQQLVLDGLGRRKSGPQVPCQEIGVLLGLLSEGERNLAPAQPSRLPACDFLEDALELGRNGPERDIADAISAIAPALRWTYSYPDDPRQPKLASSIAFAQIIGRHGLKRDDRLLLGLTLVAPETVYPLHSHPAVEFYLVIAGTALWQAGCDAATARPPGSLIFHASGTSHAMTTGAEPLLAVFTWHGDIASPAVYQV